MNQKVSRVTVGIPRLQAGEDVNNHIKSSGRVYKGDTTSNGSTCSTAGYGAIWYTSTRGKLDGNDIGPFRSYAQMYGWIFDHG